MRAPSPRGDLHRVATRLSRPGRRGMLPFLAVRIANAHPHAGVGERREPVVGRRDLDAQGLAREPPAVDPKRGTIGRAAPQPARGLAPEPLVGGVGRGRQHLPPPGRLAREDHGAAAPEALHRDDGPGRRFAGRDREHRRAGAGRPQGNDASQRGHRRPALDRLPDPAAEAHDGMTLPVRGRGDARRRAGGGAGAEDPRPPLFPQGERQQGLEGRGLEPAPLERAGAHDEQAAPPLGHERGGVLHLGRAQPRRLDVAQNDRVVAEQRLARRRVPPGQRLGPTGRALDVERALAEIVAALVDHRVDDHPGVGAQDALQEAVLVAGPPFDEQHAPGPGGGRHQHAPNVVRGHQLPLVDGNLDRVQGRALPPGRHRDDGPGDGAVPRRGHRHHPDDPAVLQHPDVERVRPEPVADGGEREVDRRPRRGRPARRHVEHLAVPGGPASAHAHREDGRPGRRVGNPGSGVGAVGHEHDAGHPPLRVAVLDLAEGAGEVAPPGLGPHRLEIEGLESLADPPQVDPHVAGEGRHHLVPERRHRRIETAPAVHVGDAHAARPIEQDREHRAIRGGGLLPHRPGEQEENQQEDGEPEPGQRCPAPPRQGRERPQVAPTGGDGEGRGQPQGHPPRPGGSESHHGAARGSASDR